MIELTFDTWEEFDRAIGSIVTLETAIATPSEQQEFFFHSSACRLDNMQKGCGPDLVVSSPYDHYMQAQKKK